MTGIANKGSAISWTPGVFFPESTFQGGSGVTGSTEPALLVPLLPGRASLLLRATSEPFPKGPQGHLGSGCLSTQAHHPSEARLPGAIGTCSSGWLLKSSCPGSTTSLPLHGTGPISSLQRRVLGCR